MRPRAASAPDDGGAAALASPAKPPTRRYLPAELAPRLFQKRSRRKPWALNHRSRRTSAGRSIACWPPSTSITTRVGEAHEIGDVGADSGTRTAFSINSTSIRPLRPAMSRTQTGDWAARPRRTGLVWRSARPMCCAARLRFSVRTT